MLPTPSTSHVSYDTVYEPAEDSYLFLDTLSSPSETAWLQSRFSRAHHANTQQIEGTRERQIHRIPLLVELGPGSGVIVAFLSAHAQTIFGTEVLSLGVDANPHACLATRTTVEKALHDQALHLDRDSDSTVGDPVNRPKQSETGPRPRSTYLTSLTGDLTGALKPGETDILVFNPPYVPTDSVPAFPSSSSPADHTVLKSSPTFEESSRLLELSYAGGVDGMEVTNRLLRQLPDVLSPRGVAYVLFCRGNRPEEVKGWIRGWDVSGADGAGSGVVEEEGKERARVTGTSKWCAETVETSGKTAGWEVLEIVRIWREET